ncbi:protein NYNRIN-like [Gossypium australe]|uniref:Protein NYNRIN-like n=1 Tax=Gossypium australe TaxID=47621 RepID=A0A5B6WNW9_9ROSI|nr:protein NYNRIN-like [Gossypium australe]
MFRDAYKFVRRCDQCQRTRNISKCDEMRQKGILEVEIFNVWGIDVMEPFANSFGNQYILLAVDYVSKWVEVVALSSNNIEAVVKFLRRNIFLRSRTPRALCKYTNELTSGQSKHKQRLEKTTSLCPSWIRCWIDLQSETITISIWILEIQPYHSSTEGSTQNNIHMPMYDGNFSDMVDKFLELFMDDFSMFRDTYDNGLGNLTKVLRRCEETNLVLNWEKRSIKIDKVKVDVIEKLPPPTFVKGVRSFLGHVGYQSFIKDFSKNAKSYANYWRRMQILTSMKNF